LILLFFGLLCILKLSLAAFEKLYASVASKAVAAHHHGLKGRPKFSKKHQTLVSGSPYRRCP
jgi:hypothetical protein